MNATDKSYSARLSQLQILMALAESIPLRCNFGAFEIIFKAHVTVDDAAGGEFNDPVGDGGDKFVVMGGEENDFAKGDQAVV